MSIPHPSLRYVYVNLAYKGLCVYKSGRSRYFVGYTSLTVRPERRYRLEKLIPESKGFTGHKAKNPGLQTFLRPFRQASVPSTSVSDLRSATYAQGERKEEIFPLFPSLPAVLRNDVTPPLTCKVTP